jgi:hypothetical protein
MSSSTILEKISKIEKGLQELKVNFLFPVSRRRASGSYPLKDIKKEVRRVRKQLWNEEYSKRI